jgi:hypothetical protein
MLDLHSKVEELELSARSLNVLISNDIFTIKDLIRRTERECLRMENMGRKSLNEIKEHLAVNGFVLGTFFEEPEKAISFKINIHLRDLFAGLAMQGIISNEGCSPEFTNTDANIAYKVADAMMKARK